MSCQSHYNQQKLQQGVTVPQNCEYMVYHCNISLRDVRCQRTHVIGLGAFGAVAVFRAYFVPVLKPTLKACQWRYL